MTDHDSERLYQQQVETFERLVHEINSVLKEYGTHDSLEPETTRSTRVTGDFPKSKYRSLT